MQLLVERDRDAGQSNDARLSNCKQLFFCLHEKSLTEIIFNIFQQ